ncbi:hypothetical protein EVAR_93369_1 [Eumeta japonica]|uniref:Uncharacterized protein n=1 Tax=Eumeta variegata TaxID=151549 RepID=A0A4C2AB33_EUMVA|nr:hypothetical protein EVAR_93369_1 [Eumeta japonica]
MGTFDDRRPRSVNIKRSDQKTKFKCRIEYRVRRAAEWAGVRGRRRWMRGHAAVDSLKIADLHDWSIFLVRSVAQDTRNVFVCFMIRSDSPGEELSTLISLLTPSTHQVITFPDVHVSADEDMPSSSRTVSSPTEALLDPESGSSYDDSEFSDDDDAEYLVHLKKIQQNLSNDEELPPQVAASARFMEAEWM